MSRNTDVFVIGGGPAGLAAAIAARMRGFEVTVADGARPPIDKACGEGLMPETLAALQELGVGIDASDGVGLRGIRFLESSTHAEAFFPGNHGIGLRRTVLHQKLIDRARDLDVRFLWETPVTGIFPGGVAAGGERIRARWIVGADGTHSRVRKWSGLDLGTRRTFRYASRRHYRVAPWSNCVEVYWGEDSQAYVTPVGEDSVCVVLVSRSRLLRLSALGKEFPALARRLSCADEIGNERGGVTLTRRLRKVHRRPVVLVGDASGSVDAITGEGLGLGFRQALALASAMESGELSRYERAHRKLAARPARMARLMLLLGGRSVLRRRAMSAFSAHPGLFNRLLSAHTGGASTMQIASAGAMLGWRLVRA